jgi:hypothetical protein
MTIHDDRHGSANSTQQAILLSAALIALAAVALWFVILGEQSID